MIDLQSVAVNVEIATVVTNSPFNQISVGEKELVEIHFAGDVHYQHMFADTTTGKRLLVYVKISRRN